MAHADAPRRFGIVLGNDLGHDPERVLRWAGADARKFRSVLEEVAGFASDDLHLLIGASADEVWAKLQQVETQIRQRRAAGQRSLLLVYYSGHADQGQLELGASSLSLDALGAFIEGSAADLRLAFLDACQSGALMGTRGGTRTVAWPIQVRDEVASSGFAFITSSAADELSHESPEYRGGYFTHFLTSALRGAADANGNRVVTLTEAYEHVYRRTVARTATNLRGTQHPMYRFELGGRGEVALADLRSRSARLLFSTQNSGRLVVLSSDRDSMLAETPMNGGTAVALALPPADYVVHFVSNGALRSGRAEVRAGTGTRLQAEALDAASLPEDLSRGSLFRAALHHEVGASLLLRRFPLEGGTLSYGTAVHYRLTPSSLSALGLEPTVRITWSAAPNQGLSQRFFDLGVTAGPGWVWRKGRTAWRIAALAGYEHLFQSDRDGRSRNSGAFTYLGLAGAELPLGELRVLIDAGAGGRVMRMRDVNTGAQTTVHRLDLQLGLGLGWRWSTR